jgi:peptidoglycan/LPS O-acetylase OafA/YrhL
MDLFAISSIVPFFLIVTGYYFVTFKILNHYQNYFVSPYIRFPTITGIRSLLALGVFIHHAIMFYFYYQHGRLETPPSIFYTLLGQVSVAIFFSITSFLFWTKAIENNGHIPFLNFLFLRIKRLAPAYILSALLILILVAISSKFILLTTTSKLVRDILFFVFGLGSIHVSSINSIDTGILGSGIFWTLRYEWKFYFLLPIAALALQKKSVRNFFVVLIICFIGVKLHRNHESLPHGLLFLPGILAAHLSKLKNNVGLVWENFSMIIGMLSLSAIFVFHNSIYTFASFFLLTVFFVSIFYWPTNSILFRLFKSQSVVFLGTISYSIYLLHLIVLYIVLTLVNLSFPLVGFSELAYWLLIFFTGILLLFFSAISYRFIELPFLKH